MSPKSLATTAAALLALTPFTLATFTPNGPTATDSFQGTSLDTSTWTPRPAGGSITQSNAVTFTSSPTDDPDLTTRTIQIPVGSFVRATARIPTAPPPGHNSSALLYLTSNSAGTTQNPFFDSYFLELLFGADGGALAGSGGSGTSTGQSLTSSLSPTINTDYTLQITRNSPTSATYAILHPSDLSVIAQQTLTVPAYPDPLYISIWGGSPVTFSSVTIPTSSLPEPTALLTLLPTMALLTRRHRRPH